LPLERIIEACVSQDRLKFMPHVLQSIFRFSNSRSWCIIRYQYVRLLRTKIKILKQC
jgi:hypothetical protein